MSWGWKIFILYTGFVLLTLAVVAYTMTQKVELVTDEYYKEEIAYQKQIERMKNARNMEEPVKVDYQPEQALLIFTFPRTHAGSDLDGTVWFYRPSDTSQDRKIHIELDDKGRQVLNVNQLAAGYWQVKVLWSSGGKEYYIQKELILQ